MYEQVKKPKENKSRSVANSVIQKKSSGKRSIVFHDNTPQFVITDNRSSTIQKARFEKPNQALSRHVSQLQEREKIISHDDAKREWLKLNKPTYTVSGKYKTDHVLDTITQSTARQASIERFKQDGKPDQASARWNLMTWTECKEDKLKNKANGSDNTGKMANVFRGKQQLTTKLSNIKSRTVTPVSLTFNESKQYEHEVLRKSNGEKIYIQFQVAAETKDTIYGVGEWKVKDKEADIYHYGANPAANEMKAEYRKWIVDGEDIIRPA